MSSLRDTVARAIRHQTHPVASSMELLPEFQQEAWRIIADAALAAIREQYAIVPREPTAEMCSAAETPDYTVGGHTESNGISAEDAAEVYRAMIAVGEVKE